MCSLTNLIVLLSISRTDTLNVHIVPKCKELYMLCPYVYMYIYTCTHIHMYMHTYIDIYIIHICFMHVHNIYILKSDTNFSML